MKSQMQIIHRTFFFIDQNVHNVLGFRNGIQGTKMQIAHPTSNDNNWHFRCAPFICLALWLLHFHFIIIFSELFELSGVYDNRAYKLYKHLAVCHCHAMHSQSMRSPFRIANVMIATKTWLRGQKAVREPIRFDVGAIAMPNAYTLQSVCPSVCLNASSSNYYRSIYIEWLFTSDGNFLDNWVPSSTVTQIHCNSSFFPFLYFVRF